MTAFKQLRLLFAAMMVLWVSACTATITPTTPTPTNLPPTLTPTAVPSPTPMATATQPPVSGTTRANPLPFGGTIHQPPRQVSVTEILRGEKAFSFLQDHNAFVSPPPDGQEYLLLNVRVQNIGTEDTEMSVSAVDFDVTGDNLRRYNPDFGLSDLRGGLFPGGELTGTLVFAVAPEEHNLLLISDPLDGENTLVFLALEEGAAIMPAYQIVMPSNNGLSRKNPAQLGEEISTGEWKLTVNRIIRGEKAWQRIQQANMYNDPPAAGMTYLLIEASVQYLGDSESGEMIDSNDFKITGSRNVVYDAPSVVEPEPALDATLFPGGQTTGWLVMEVGADEDTLLLIFSPGYSTEEDRFIRLEE